MSKEHPILELIDRLVNVPGWIFIGAFEDPPPAPEGFRLETRHDGFLGYVTHYRHLPLQEAGGPGAAAVCADFPPLSPRGRTK